MLDRICIDTDREDWPDTPAMLLCVLDSMCVNCGLTQQVLNINNNLVNILIRAYIYIRVNSNLTIYS